MTERIWIYDTTLRDGAQAEGIAFSLNDKIDIIKGLDAFGMDFIEGGMPSSNPKDLELLTESCPHLAKGKMVAFGSTCRPGTEAKDDQGLNVLVSCKAEWVCIFGKSWDFQVKEVLSASLEENLRMIKDSIDFLRSKGKKVIFDAEHFFDGYKANPEYAMKVVDSASEAEWIVLCDTNGGSLPGSIHEITSKVVMRIGKKVGIHCHNDSDLAVANSLAAVEAGATMVQGTVNGIGERCGNANLCSVLPDLKFKLGYDIPIDLTKLTMLSNYVSETANIRHIGHMPYVGQKAFAHKGGMHVNALLKDKRTYEHIDPAAVGNDRKILISDMSGRASISEKLRAMGLNPNDETLNRITETVKEMEATGFLFEGSDASLYLLARRMSSDEAPPFKVEGFRLTMDGVGLTGIAEATIKVRDASGTLEHTAADGKNGPVDALDRALRKALSKFYPIIDQIRLIDYKVRVLDEDSATAAKVRVLIRSTDGKTTWNTVGVSENVVGASLIAITDSIEYAVIMANKRNEQ